MTTKTKQNNTFIEIKNFAINYADRQVLKDVNFILKEKEWLTLVGESGCGKTTILRSIVGLVKPDHGEVNIENQNIVNLKEEDLFPFRKKVAFAFQNGALFDSMTVFENLAFPLREHTKLSEEAISKRVMYELEEFEMQHAVYSYPVELSGGMRKRVGIARATILKPKVILYDEPTAGLDPYNTSNVVKMMLKLKKRGVASILVTHNIDVAKKVSDKIALLLDGSIKAIGTPENLENSYNILLHNFIKGIKG